MHPQSWLGTDVQRWGQMGNLPNRSAYELGRPAHPSGTLAPRHGELLLESVWDFWIVLTCFKLCFPYLYDVWVRFYVFSSLLLAKP